MFFLRLAVLSILSHRRRSAVIAASVAVSVVVMIFVEGMLGGLRVSFFENLLQGTGHIQIHAAGWQNRLDPYSIKYILHDPNDIIQRIQGDRSIAAEITGVEPMLQFGALLVHGDRNVAMAGQAVETTTRFFLNVRNTMRAGRFLPGKGVAISETIARLLGLSLSDPVVVLVQDATGSPYYLSYPVTGIFSTGVQQTDDGVFFIGLREAQDLLDLPGGASELRMTLAQPDAAPRVARELTSLLSPEKPFIETWRDIQSGLVTLINLGNLYSMIIDIIIAVVAATVITSSILMTIFERIPTFGTLRAIGLKRKQLFWSLLEEGLLLGFLGSALGMAAGLPLVLYLQVHGLDVGAFSQVLGTTTAYHFVVTMRAALTVFAAGILIAALGYLYGASVSVRMRLLDSLEQGV
jgi:ABC-type lipoprotein release transport system permease subunit